VGGEHPLPQLVPLLLLLAELLLDGAHLLAQEYLALVLLEALAHLAANLAGDL